MLIFTEGEKPENPEKNPHGKGEINNTSNKHQLTCPEQESNLDHSGERRALKHYATHANSILKDTQAFASK
jgi:hypothetical protein